MHDRILLSRTFQFSDFAITRRTASDWHVAPHIAQEIDEVWERDAAAFTNAGVLVWDGKPYRLENLPEFMKTSSTGPIPLTIAPIRYRYLNAFRRFGTEMIQTPESWPNHVSIGGPIRTADGWYVMGERSGTTVSTHRYDFIGGGVGEDEIVLNSGENLRAVHIIELEEEVNILEEHIAELHGIGVLQSATTAVLIMLLTDITLTRAELEKRFETRSDPEMAGLVFKREGDFQTFLSSIGAYHALLPQLLMNVASSSGS